MISDKYVAGLIDADGCFDIIARKVNNKFYVRPRVRITQKFEIPLPLKKRTTRHGFNEYSLKGKEAVRLINKIKKHLVLKDGQAEWISNTDFSKGREEADLKNLRETLRTLRFLHVNEKQFPSRKWLAGYFDGDGCITAGLRKGRQKPYIASMITVDKRDKRAVDLIAKNFKGSIIDKTETTCRWDLWLNPTNAEKFLTYFHKHMILKRYEADMVLDWFRNKHKIADRNMSESFVRRLSEAKATRND